MHDLPADMSAEELAALFDCSTRTIYDLVARGVVLRTGTRGRYDSAASITRYVTRLRGHAKAIGHPQLVAANARLRRAKAEQAEQRVRALCAKLVDADEAHACWAEISAGIGRLVLGLPAKIAFAVPTLTRADRDIIEQICRDDLQDAAMERGFDFATAGNGPTGGADAFPDDDGGQGPAAA